MANKETEKKMKPILETVHETAKGLHDAGVMDTKTMHEFKELNDGSPIKDGGGLGA